MAGDTDRPARGLATQIFAATAVVVTLSLLLVYALTARRARAIAEATLRVELDAVATTLADAVRARDDGLARVAHGLVRVPAYHAAFEAARAAGDSASLLDQAEEYRDQLGVDWVMLVDDAGVLLAWTRHPGRRGESFGDGALVRRALAGDATRGSWLEPADEGDLLFQAVAVPVRAPGGVVRGAVIAATPLDSAAIATLARQARTELVLATLDTLGAPHVTVTTVAPDRRGDVTRALGQRTPHGAVDLHDGREAYEGRALPLTTANGDTVGLLVGLRATRLAMATIDPLRTSGVIALVIGLALALVTGLWQARRIAAPLRTLARATRAVRDGTDTVALPAHAPREVAELAHAFGALVEELRTKDELVALLRTPHATSAPAMVSRLEVGARFAQRYEITALLGSGGMGEVYRAIDRELHEVVALKTVRPELLAADDDSLVARFREEIRLARRIAHRNVVRTHDLGVFEGRYYLTMEYVAGRSLGEVLRQEHTLSVGAVHAIALQLCRALGAAHEAGVIHRDIKPANLLVDQAGVLKVTDFGVARLVDDAREAARRLTSTGHVIGTVDYMAPEQLGGDPVDARADVYAAGAVLYECLTGVSPHAGLSLSQLLSRAALGAPAADPRRLRPETPDALGIAVMRALEPMPDTRWASAMAMLSALDDTRMAASVTVRFAPVAAPARPRAPLA